MTTTILCLLAVAGSPDDQQRIPSSVTRQARLRTLRALATSYQVPPPIVPRCQTRRIKTRYQRTYDYMLDKVLDEHLQRQARRRRMQRQQQQQQQPPTSPSRRRDDDPDLILK